MLVYAWTQLIKNVIGICSNMVRVPSCTLEDKWTFRTCFADLCTKFSCIPMIFK